MNANKRRDLNDRKVDRITSSLSSLAQCAVGILSLMGIANLTIVGFSIQEKSSLLMLFGIGVILVAIVVHYLILLWGLPQLIEFALLDIDKNEYIGLKCLLCSIYFIEDWEYKKKLIRESTRDQSNVRKMFNRAKREVCVPIWSNRFGILALLYIALFSEILFVIFSTLFLGFSFISIG